LWREQQSNFWQDTYKLLTGKYDSLYLTRCSLLSFFLQIVEFEETLPRFMHTLENLKENYSFVMHLFCCTDVDVIPIVRGFLMNRNKLWVPLISEQLYVLKMNKIWFMYLSLVNLILCFSFSWSFFYFEFETSLINLCQILFACCA